MACKIGTIDWKENEPNKEPEVHFMSFYGIKNREQFYTLLFLDHDLLCIQQDEEDEDGFSGGETAKEYKIYNLEDGSLYAHLKGDITVVRPTTNIRVV